MVSFTNSPNTTQAIAPSTQFVRAKYDRTWDQRQLLQDVEGKNHRIPVDLKHRLKEHFSQFSGNRKR
ncbi:hypothetical protein Lal_00000793 [Lupinus albus]|nr:hypothetical protein Lal_00000793 [Lupinus albus]